MPLHSINTVSGRLMGQPFGARCGACFLVTVPVGATASQPRCWPLPPIRAGAMRFASVRPPSMPQPIAGGACSDGDPPALGHPFCGRGPCRSRPAVAHAPWHSRALGRRFRGRGPCCPTNAVVHAAHATCARSGAHAPTSTAMASPGCRVAIHPWCRMPHPTARFIPQRPTNGMAAPNLAREPTG